MAIQKITLPDFGEVKKVIIVEIFVSPGDEVEKDSSLMSLESDKAVMDLPSPFSGIIKEIKVSEEDQINTGDFLATIEVIEEQAKPVQVEKELVKEEVKEIKIIEETSRESSASSFHATPSVRAYARELELDLTSVEGTGPKGRILKADVLNLVKQALRGGSSIGSVTEEPLEDFSKYGEIEEVKLGRIKKISGPHLQKSWSSIPHVTHFDEADITDMETFRKQLNKESEKEGVKFSPLVFVVKAVVSALKDYPSVNSSLVPGGGSLILKKFYNIGIAVDTAQGLVVPVLRDVDKKGIKEISEELKSLSIKARDGKLSVTELQGATFTISSLGGIGGTGFTPIINRPQVAILGLSRSELKPVWDGEQFIPRLTLPLSLSYDHRVIDGAEAARFCRSLSQYIEDLKRTLI